MQTIWYRLLCGGIGLMACVSAAALEPLLNCPSIATSYLAEQCYVRQAQALHEENIAALLKRFRPERPAAGTPAGGAAWQDSSNPSSAGPFASVGTAPAAPTSQNLPEGGSPNTGSTTTPAKETGGWYFGY